MRTLRVLMMVLLILGLATSLNAQSAREKPNLVFFQGGNGTAHWKAGDSAGTDDDMAIALAVPGVSLPDYAGLFFQRAGGIPPAEAPSFMFKSSVSGNSGGSPRMVFLWNDGGTSELRPLFWTTSWELVDGNGQNWDNNGGSCGFLYATSYATTVGCHTPGWVVAVFIVTDSGWLASPYTHLIDNISLYGYTFSSPKDNANQ